MKRSKKYDNRLTLRDLYDQYWHCRDFEINNLWQRSIFLGTFLALCYTGYGVFFGKAFFDDKGKLALFTDFQNCATIPLICDPIALSHLIAVAIACVGAILSLLWIYMAKSSKAWQEVYEAAIAAIDMQPGFMPEKVVLNPLKENVGGFHMERLTKYGCNGEKEFSDCFLSPNGGGFSPSKINICLGQVSLVIWIIIGLIHILGIANNFIYFLFMGIVVAIILIVLFFTLNDLVKSKNLESKAPRLIYKEKIEKNGRKD